MEVAGQVAEQLPQLRGRVVAIGTDDRERGMIVVADRRPFAQELRLEADEEVLAFDLTGSLLDDRAQHVFDRARHEGGAEHENMRPVDATQRLAQVLGQLEDCRLVLAAVGRRRCTDADQRQLAVAQRLGRVGRDADPAAGHDLGHQLDHPFFDHRRLAGSDQGELGGIDVDTDDSMAVAREARERNCTDIAETKNADVHDD